MLLVNKDENGCPRIFAIDLSVGAVLYVALTAGCGGAGIDVALKPTDKPLSQRVVKLVEAELGKLSQQNPIIERYGRFESLSLERLTRFRAHRVLETGYPASLNLTCRCVFTKFETPLDIVIVSGKESEVTFHLLPSSDDLLKQKSKYEPVQKVDGLWFNFGKQDQLGSHSTHSIIDCRVTHPEFQP